MNETEIIEKFSKVRINGLVPSKQIVKTLAQIPDFDYDDFICWIMNIKSTVGGGMLMEYLNR